MKGKCKFLFFWAGLCVLFMIVWCWIIYDWKGKLYGVAGCTFVAFS